LSTGLSSVNKILLNFNFCIFKPPQPNFDYFLSVLAFSFNCYILFYFCIFILFLFFLRERKKCEFGNNSKMGYDSCPPLYNAYEAKILRSKFCKEEKKKKRE
jgi:hypothetical protein